MNQTHDPFQAPDGAAPEHGAETLTRNGVSHPAKLSICIPAWRDAATPLLTSLANLPDHQVCEILIYDDGSADPDMTAAITSSLSGLKGPATLITAHKNHGRSYARNRLMSHATSDWLLMLDADMLPDDSKFLTRYLDAMSKQSDPALIAGGFSLQHVKETKAQALHAAQSRRSECLSADERKTEPGRFVFTSNILAHRAVLDAVSFDDGYKGWGWEDVDWGLRVAQQFPVLHIDNTATHLGLDDTATLLRKYGTSGHNFSRLASQHPDAVRDMALYKVARRLRGIPGRPVIAGISKYLATDRFGLTPMPLRLLALKLYRSAVYSENLS
ncbi:MAG: glycosyltransferase family 2 protein [Hyphomonadaceae bacterium]